MPKSKKRNKETKGSRLRPALASISVYRRARDIIMPLAVGILLPVSIYFLILLNSMFFAPVIESDMLYTIKPGQSVASVAHDLDLGDDFVFFVRRHGGVIKMGTYDIQKGAGTWRLAKMFTKGQVASRTVMIPEGLTVRQVINLLNAHPDLTGEITEIKYTEGELFPDTYIVSKGMDRNDVLKIKARQMHRVAEEFAGSTIPVPLNDWNDVLTLASIVQKETSKKSEMPIVASVYLNRLRQRMRLQADPTVVFFITNGLGDMQGARLLTRHLRIPNPFNTYTNRGLPPSPIANVGIDAIKAVLYPADTDYLFFVADGKGGHNFSRTYTEHNVHRRAWQEHRRMNGI